MSSPSSHEHSHDHGHSHDHDHDNHFEPVEARVRALETILSAKGLIDSAAVDAIIDTYQDEIGPKNGAQVVAKAWTDPDYAAWLAKDANAAIESMGFAGRQGEHMQAVFNTPTLHNVVVCTLCSCYPWPVLGLPPVWYKSPAYRSRVVLAPREVLAEFGVNLADDVEVRVWDSTAELRYLVVPQRPEGSESMSVDQLAALVNRDSMIGTGLADSPKAMA